MRRLGRTGGLLWVAAAGVLIVNIYPMFWLLLGSFKGPKGSFTLANYGEVFTSLGDVTTLKNSFILAVGSIALALVAGLLSALGTSRIVTPFSKLVRVASTIAFVSPPWVAAMAYAQLMSPNNGLINQWFNAWTGHKPFNIYTMAGVIFVTAIFLYPYIYLTITAALDNMDSSYEEAAIATGCSPIKTIFKITLPLVTPALITSTVFSLVMVWGLYSVPAILGVPGKVYVFATYLYTLLNTYPPRLGLSSAMAVFFAVVSSILFWVGFRAGRTGKAGRYQVIGGKGHRSVRMQIGWPAYVLTALNLIFVALSLVVPYLVTFILSVSRSVYQPPSLSNLSLKHYIEAFTDTNFLPVLKNTLQIGILMALIGGVIAIMVAYVDLRSESRLKDALTFSAMFPLAVPAVAFVIGVAWAWVRPPVVLYGTIWIIIICQIARYLPLGVQSFRDGLSQLHTSLEEAARTCGSGAVSTILRISLPIIRPTLVSTVLLLFMSSLRDLLTPLFLGTGTPHDQTLGSAIYYFWIEGATGRSSALSMIMVAVMFIAYYPITLLLGGPKRVRRSKGGVA